MNAVIFCDFDGTICIPDSSEYLLEKFGTPRWMELEREVWEGKITEREAFALQLETMHVDWPEACAELLRGVRVREGFAEFVEWTKRMRISFTILSSGLRILLDELLRQWGIAGVPVFCQDAAISDGNWRLVAYAGERFEEHCSLCKCVYLEEQRAAGKKIVYIGDGFTDICPSRRADILFATGHLSRLWRENGSRRFYSFETFHDIERQLSALNQEDQELKT
jgi:2-hydroxy-3-keto-5-methylthiopentenyl-1-phosphate phosphatase